MSGTPVPAVRAAPRHARGETGAGRFSADELAGLTCTTPAAILHRADLIAKHGLTFPVGFGADARAIADLTGAFVNPDPVYLQSAGFVLDPAGRVVVSVYSSGAIGRLVPEDVAGLVRYVREHAAA